MTVPEINAVVGNQLKMLKRVVYNIMERKFLSEFTWTGKSIGGRKKLAIRDSKNIVELFYAIVFHIDETYSRSTFSDHLKNKILKYAYE